MSSHKNTYVVAATATATTTTTITTTATTTAITAAAMNAADEDATVFREAMVPFLHLAKPKVGEGALHQLDVREILLFCIQYYPVQ